MEQCVTPKHFTAIDIEWPAGKVGDSAACLLHQQNARGGVPGVEIKLPVRVIASARQVAKIKRCRARAADAMRAQRNLVIKLDVRVLVSFVAGKACGHKTLFQLGDGRDMNWAAIQEGT